MFPSDKPSDDALSALRRALCLLARDNYVIMETKEFPYLRDKVLNLLLKWPGGKSSDLKHLRANLPDLFPKSVERYFEPFLGGGAVWLAVQKSVPMLVNDICSDLMDFYGYVKAGDEKFFDCIARMDTAWDVLHKIAKNNLNRLYDGEPVLADYRDELTGLSLSPDYDCYPVLAKTFKSKVIRIKTVERRNMDTAIQEAKKARPDLTPNEEKELSDSKKLSQEDCLDNVEGALKAGYYTYVRDIYNEHITGDKCCPLRSACFYFLRDYCFSSMFRYNAAGHFNVPYGGLSYNSRSPAARVSYWKSGPLLEHLRNTIFCNEDFEDFLNRHQPTAKDFMFIDPPYDSEFSTYDKKEFGQKDQQRLADYLIDKTKAQFLAVMKNTEFIFGLYKGHEQQGVRCVTFDKDYQVSFRNRNDRSVKHLVVYRTAN